VHRRRSSSRQDRIAYVIRITSMVLDGLGIPRYFSAYSNRMYDNHMKISLLILKQYLDVSYRELCGMLSSLKIWKGQTPNHSTLVKFSKRLETDVPDRLLRQIARMLCKNDMVVAADATGFSCSNASRHFVKRLKEMGRKEGITYTNTAVRGFSKASFAVDTETKMILACGCADSDHADVKRMTYLIDDLAESSFSISFVVADKGYDAEYVHREIRERLHAKTMIPIREMANLPKERAQRKQEDSTEA
jgi:hypothetical protein